VPSVIGLIANVLVRPVAREWFMSDAAVAALQVKGGATDMAGAPDAGRVSLTSVLAGSTVGIPILWGVWITLDKVAALFM
jgi:hypothetical protein